MGDSLPAVALGTGRTAVAIAAGAYHTCALLDNGIGEVLGRQRLRASWGWVTPSTGVTVPGEMGDSLPAVASGYGSHRGRAHRRRRPHVCVVGQRRR